MTSDFTRARRARRTIPPAQRGVLGVLEATANLPGEALFSGLVQGLLRELDLQAAFVGHLLPPDSRSGSLTCATATGGLLDPLRWRHLHERSLLDALDRAEVRPSCVVPLRSMAGDTIGWIGVEGAPGSSPELTQALGVLATRAAAEVERQQARHQANASERRFRRYIERAYDAVLVVDDQARIQYANPAASRIYGYTAAELRQLTIPDLIAADPHSQAEGAAHFGRVVQTGESLGEVRGRRKDGTVIITDVSAVSLGDGRFLGTIRDTTDRRMYADNLKLTSAVFDSTSEGIMITDARGRILRVNRSFSAVTGWTEAEAVGKTPRLLRSGRHDQAFYADMWRQIETKGRWEGEIWNRRKSGAIFPELLTINSLSGPDGKVAHYVAVFADITAHKQSEDRLVHLAHHDPLTGLANRTLLHERLARTITRSAREEQRFALLFIDLDDFKTINDTLGHEFGDELLVAVAARLTDEVRDGDTLVRQGGDEFVIVAEHCHGHASTSAFARRLLRGLHRPFSLRGRDVFVTASIGISLYPEDGITGADLLKNADAAMYRAKAEGRNRHEFFAAEMNHAARARLDVEGGLRHALDRGEFRLEYQPIAEQDRVGAGHVEALLRWDRPGHGVVGPGTFMELAEDCGIIVEIDRWVLWEACRQAAIWEAAGDPRCTSVNLSSRQFRDPRLPELVEAVLRQTGLSGARLQLEITERVLLHNDENVRHIIGELHQMGVRVVIDDFGTGYSALSYLHRFPLDGLKIDRSFVADVIREPRHAALVRTIVAMARALELDVVAEGVENPRQLDFLLQNGCTRVQGFFLGRPARPDTIPHWTFDWRTRAREQ